MALPYSLAKIQEIIGQNLGYGVIDVELNREHYARAIDAAFKILARWYPSHGYQVISAVPGGYKYQLTPKNILGVLDATFMNSGPRFEEAPYYVRWVDRSMELADMRDTQHVFGDQPDWHWQFEPDPITGLQMAWLYTTFGRSSFVDTFARIPDIVCVQFAWAFEASDDPAVGVNAVPFDMRQWVEDYATARCRMILGDIRGKFGGVPGQGDNSVMPTDAGSQIQRAVDDMKRLEEDLKDRRRQAPLLID